MITNDALLGKPQTSSPQRGGGRMWLVILLLVLAAIAAGGILIRFFHHQALGQRTHEESVPTVTVVKPTQAAASDEITLPGSLQAFVDAPIYARTDGYLKSWTVDIGGHVKAGELLATIETPELDEQLQQARAAVNTAQANYNLSVVTNRRYQLLVKTQAVSREEADQNASNELAQKAQLDAAIANVKHFLALQSFEKVYAPFDGVVTERNTDVGQLISSGIGGSGGSGNGATGRELFRVATLDKLRTFIPVPQNQAAFITPGMQASLTFAERPGQKFSGVVARTSRAIDTSSRTLLTEVDIDNREGKLFPGAYVDVHLHVPSTATTGAVQVPANTLVFRAHGMQIATVGDDKKIKLNDIQIGRDFGNTVEVVSGITPDDQIVLNPPDSLEAGQQVNTAPPPQEKAAAVQDNTANSKKNAAGETGSGNETKKKPTQEDDIKPSRGSGGATQKVSRAPDDKGGGAAGGGGSGQSNTKGTATDSGLTAPGSDGNAQK